MLDSDAPVDPTATSDGTPPRRRRSASRPAGPPPDRVAQASEPQAVELPVAEPAPIVVDDQPVRARRTRSPKKSAPAEVLVEAPVEVEVETVSVALESVEADQPELPVAPKRRSRSRKAEAVADAAPDADIEASLAALEDARPRRSRRAKGVDDRDRALDELAAAIGEQLADGEEIDLEELADEIARDIPGLTPEQALALAADLAEVEEDEELASRRRRRRRGGRRRRRGADGPLIDVVEGEDDEESEPESDGEDEAVDVISDEAASGTSRRRRRRRRRGEDAGSADDDPTDVVVKVREPRRGRAASEEVTGIEGSTRMEAKRQRRRDGRAAGRRRTPILSEAEFLARRESVDRRMLIRQSDDYTQIGVLEDGVLVEHYVDRASAMSLIGNIYLGRIQNVLPSMEAAFIDIGRGRNAVLYAGEVDWDSFGEPGSDRKVERVFKSGQAVLVQVTKDPVGAKGARLTSHISIPGRYVVYSPGGQLAGISRKLPEPERKRLKDILDDLVGDDASVIVRTAAEGASEEELVRDVTRLKAQWEIIEKKVKAGQAPQMLYAEPDLTVRIVRDLFTEDFSTLIVDGNGRGEDAWDTVNAYVTHVAPHLAERLQGWDREELGDLFEVNRVNEQVAKALERKVFLPSGGSLVIDRTEAMTVVDVNTGKFTGTSGNLEATVTSNNLEAAEEIVRQLRLRDIGGIIVIDFIDMVLSSNRELLLRRLVECLGRDRTRHQVAEVTSLGLVQMTRKKIGTGLAEAFTVTCETCHGRGYHTHDAPVETQAPSDGGERESTQRRSRGRSSGRSSNGE